MLLTDLATGCTNFYASRVIVDPTFDCTTGTNEPVLSGFTILPNPASTAMLMHLDKATTGNTLLRVWDAGGRLVHTEAVDAGAVDIPVDCQAWPNGLFFLELRSGNYRNMGKLMLIK